MRLGILVVSLWLTTSPLWGKIVFYSKPDGNNEIYTMDLDGSNPTRLTFNHRSDHAPTWSPNGQQIAFVSYRDDVDDPHKGEKNAEIYVMDADGSNPRRLTHSPGLDVRPDWHPNGNQIAFVSSRNANEKKSVNIFVMDADGGNVRQITDLEFASSPKWSPDGKLIALTAFMGENREIFVVNLNGTVLFKVSDPLANVDMFLGGWSPNGTQILYIEAIDSGVDKVFPVIATLDPFGQRKVRKWDRVPVPRMPMDSESFSADGKSILFSGKRNNQWDIYRFSLIDHSLIQLTDNPAKDAGAREWDPRLSVQPQQLLPLFWGEIKSNGLRY